MQKMKMLFAVAFASALVFSCAPKMEEDEKEERPSLRLTHHDGEEIYFVERAQWNHVDDGLWLEIRCSEDLAKEYIDHIPANSPIWEVNIIDPQIRVAYIGPPFEVKVPGAYYEELDGWVTNFYYYDHGGTYENHVTILDRKEDKILVRMTGEAPDIIHYDGSKPAVKLEFEGSFSFNEKGARSMQ